MSGHSKWSTIRHKKAIEDAKKGAAFTKVAKQIYIAVKKGDSGDPEKNPSLRMVLEEARSINMPGENIRRAIERAIGVKGGTQMFEIVYEGYVMGGTGVMVTVVTDNKNRTGGEIKMLFERYEGSLGGPGSVAYLKNLQPPMLVNLEGETKEKVLEFLDTVSEMEETVSLWTNLEGYE